MSCPFGSSCNGCTNCLGDLTGRKKDSGGILAGLDESVASTCAEAMSYVAERVRKHVCGRELFVMSGSDSRFDVEMKIGQQSVTFTLQPAAQCNFPITASYTKGADSGSGQFQTLDDVVRYLSFRLRD